MKIDCISDLHGFHPELEGGDLLIIAGDLTARDEFHQYEAFFQWLQYQKYKTIIYIAGNHDGLIEKRKINVNTMHNIRYLEDSMTIVDGLKIWGSPWTPEFCNWHFMKPRPMMKEVWDKIPDDIDILITHGPPYGILDDADKENARLGCFHLTQAIERVKPRLHVFGHIHGGYGQDNNDDTTFVNAAIMNEDYRPVNKPIRIEL